MGVNFCNFLIKHCLNEAHWFQISISTDVEVKARDITHRVFLSYHWDMQNKVERIKDFLKRHGCPTCTDTSRPMVVNTAKKPSGQYHMFGAETKSIFLQEEISYCTVIVLCITLKYLHSDNFTKDTQLAKLHKKSVIPIMLQWCSRPLERVATVARKLELSSRLLDMSNEQLFRRNLPELANLIKKITSKPLS